MRSFYILGLLGLLSSCDVDSIIKTYEDRWQTNLIGVLPRLNIGAYGGLSTFEDGSILALREIVLNDGSSEIATFNISDDGEVIETKTSFQIDQNINIRQPSKNANVVFSGRSPSNFDLYSFLTITDDLTFESRTVDLSQQLGQISQSDNHLSPNYLYVGGNNLNGTGHSILKINRNGQSEWNLELENESSDFFEGMDEEFFILINDDDVKQLVNVNSEGEVRWTTALDGSDSEIPAFNLTHGIFGSPSNTISIIGTDESDNFLIVFIDSTGDFIFQRFYPGFNNAVFQDFMVMSDGAFMMLLTGIDTSNGPSFTVLKLNHRAAETWRSNYLTEEANSIEFIELRNQDVVILTSVGNLFLIEDS